MHAPGRLGGPSQARPDLCHWGHPSVAWLVFRSQINPDGSHTYLTEALGVAPGLDVWDYLPFLVGPDQRV